MIIKCKECGSGISEHAKFCPKCGCPNKHKTKLNIVSFVLGIIAILYAFGLSTNVYFDGYQDPSFFGVTVIFSLLSIIFGITSIKKISVEKKALTGIILGLISLLIALVIAIFIV